MSIQLTRCPHMRRDRESYQGQQNHPLSTPRSAHGLPFELPQCAKTQHIFTSASTSSPKDHPASTAPLAYTSPGTVKTSATFHFSTHSEKPIMKDATESSKSNCYTLRVSVRLASTALATSKTPINTSLDSRAAKAHSTSSWNTIIMVLKMGPHQGHGTRVWNCYVKIMPVIKKGKRVYLIRMGWKCLRGTFGCHATLSFIQ
jgi:hypothetical protein